MTIEQAVRQEIFKLRPPYWRNQPDRYIEIVNYTLRLTMGHTQVYKDETCRVQEHGFVNFMPREFILQEEDIEFDQWEPWEDPKK